MNKIKKTKVAGVRVKVGDLGLSPGQPKPKGSETILSEEMWERVLLNLTDPSDVLNAGKTCVQFQRILHTKMIETHLAKTLPLLMNYMDGKSVVKCRSVSKGWRGAVDEFLESYFLGRSILVEDKQLGSFPVTGDHASLYPFGASNEYYSNVDPERFIREMRDHPGNPFIGRAVSFQFIKSEDDADEAQVRQDFRTFSSLLDIFGRHIWTLELDIYALSRFSFEFESDLLVPFMMRDVFVLAPNLRSFLIKSAPRIVSMRKNDIRALPPPPPSLQKLDCSAAFYDRQDCKVERAILLRHNELSALHIRSIDSLQMPYNNSWPNLRELLFTEIERIDRLVETFRALRLPQLELLSIRLEEAFSSERKWKRSKARQKRTFINLFAALNELKRRSPNLKTLRFGTTWLWDKDSDEPVGFPIGLPCPANIKTLEIPEETVYYCNSGPDFNGTSDYSFLLRFPHVENIRVVRDGLDDDARTRHPVAFEIVQVHQFMYEGRMYESNIWQLLPKLKVFSYGERVYTRQSYDRRQQRLNAEKKKSEGESRRHRECGTQTVSTGDIISIDYEGFIDN